MDLRNPGDFYAKYVSDFGKHDGPCLLQLSWQDKQGDSLWTYLNMAYLTLLATKNGFTPVGERNRLDLCWFNKPPWAFSPQEVECELAVEEEWGAEKDDEDLKKLLSVDAHLKVFITALEYSKWKECEFQETIRSMLRESDSKRYEDAYLLINISPYPLPKQCEGLQVNGIAVYRLGNCTELPSARFPWTYTGL